MSVDKFWADDITVLFDKDKLAVFFPTKNMDSNEILNALVRASLYLSVILFVYKRNTNIFFIVIGTLVLTYLIHSYSPSKHTNNNNNESGNNNNNNNENGDSSKENFTGNIEQYHEMDEMLQKTQCVTPTVDNPFMNVSLGDYNTMPNREVCGDVLDNQVLKNDIGHKFHNNLYQDVGDIWDRNNSQRQFYTMPNTSIPNKQKEFALWLYNRGPTCKEGNGYQCFANMHHPHEKRLPPIPHADS